MKVVLNVYKRNPVTVCFSLVRNHYNLTYCQGRLQNLNWVSVYLNMREFCNLFWSILSLWINYTKKFWHAKKDSDILNFWIFSWSKVLYCVRSFSSDQTMFFLQFGKNNLEIRIMKMFTSFIFLMHCMKVVLFQRATKVSVFK